MLICNQHAQQSSETSIEQSSTTDWSEDAQLHSNLPEAVTFLTHSKEVWSTVNIDDTVLVDPSLLRGKQKLVYECVKEHLDSAGTVKDPLRMIVSGTAGTGKSFLINCLKGLLQQKLCVAAPTGVTAFNVQGVTLHSLLQLPTHGNFQLLQGVQLQRLQSSLSDVEYLIIDEMSMVGQRMMGQIDQHLRQAFPHKANEVLGGCSCLLVGDFGQLPPVMDLPLYSSVSTSATSDLGRTAYQMFSKAVVLTQIMRQTGDSSDQVQFREILLRLRDGSVTAHDWNILISRCKSRICNSCEFDDALHLFPTIEAAGNHNFLQMQLSDHPIALIKAVHSGANAAKASADDASGLEPMLSICRNARVMLTFNLWIDAGLVNVSMGTVLAICY